MDTPLCGILDLSARSVNEPASGPHELWAFQLQSPMSDSRPTSEAGELVSQHSGKNLAGFFGHGTGDIQMRDGTKTVSADGIDQEAFLL